MTFEEQAEELRQKRKAEREAYFLANPGATMDDYMATQPEMYRLKPGEPRPEMDTGFDIYDLDVMDWTGHKAEEARDEAAYIAEGSTRQGITSEQDQIDFIRKLFEPYYKTAESSLPGLQSLIMGGKVADNYKPSDLYEFQKKMGERNIMRSQAARGMLGSSGTEMKLAALYGDLGSEESNRVYSDLLSQIQLGTGALGSFGQANTASAGAVGSLYGNLGRQLSGLESAYGQSRASAYQGLSNAFMGLGQYMAIKGV